MASFSPKATYGGIKDVSPCMFFAILASERMLCKKRWVFFTIKTNFFRSYSKFHPSFRALERLSIKAKSSSTSALIWTSLLGRLSTLCFLGIGSKG